ncbi:hypothetical protein [Streptomyces sudanensis]|uniref:hypothetical protein n=1 Tax=Streptomyces sudanensis TaxID=436397 RepID=UPI003FD7F3A3
MTTARISGAVWAALAIVYLVWGSTYLGIRIAVETLPPSSPPPPASSPPASSSPRCSPGATAPAS